MLGLDSRAGGPIISGELPLEAMPVRLIQSWSVPKLCKCYYLAHLPLDEHAIGFLERDRYPERTKSIISSRITNRI